MPKKRKRVMFNGVEMTKSDAVRTALEQNPKAKASEIQNMLREAGIGVTGTLIYGVRGRMMQGKRKERRAAAVKAASANGVLNPAAAVMSVKRLAADLGGMQRLKELVDALTELR